ncbi:MAG: YqaE/Pmp3 family membrane protein [Rhodospirillaceae bacterium]|nr:YqaE/Pmp3 family membrane protein [Rhodospirillaceae bacterium]
MAFSSNTGDSLGGDLFRIILAIILPPLGVFFEVGLTKHFWINVLLTLLGYVPGIVHAVWIIARR